LTLNADSSVTAGFDYDVSHQVQVSGGSTGYYPTIQAAYNAAASGDVIKLWSTSYNESLLCNRPIQVTFKGGYDSGYATLTGQVILIGTLSITNGVVIADGLSIQ